MTTIQHLIRSAAPALVMAAVFAAAPASANEHKKSAPNHKKAVADLKSCAKPLYPADAVKSKHEGAVTLGFLVGADSMLVESKVEKSSGHTELDDATRAALTKCKFKAASQNGKPVQEWMQVQYVWSLK